MILLSTNVRQQTNKHVRVCVWLTWPRNCLQTSSTLVLQSALCRTDSQHTYQRPASTWQRPGRMEFLQTALHTHHSVLINDRPVPASVRVEWSSFKLHSTHITAYLSTTCQYLPASGWNGVPSNCTPHTSHSADILSHDDSNELFDNVNHKKRGTLFLTITTIFLGQFLHFLQQMKQE